MNPNLDQFGFTLKLDKKTPKRRILSEFSRLFDQLGWLSPTIIQQKLFVQLLWMDKFSWDQPYSDGILQHHIRLRIRRLGERPLTTESFDARVRNRLPTTRFCNATTTADAAVVFLRQIVGDCIETKLLTAKKRVGLTKSICVPLLELYAALLGAKLIEAVSLAINNERFPKPIFFAWYNLTVTIA